MGFEIKGLNKLQNKLKQMERSTKELEGTKQVPFSDLFTSSFMHEHTNFSTFDDLLKAGNFTVNSQKDFEEIPDAQMDSHINNVTTFSSWQDMLDKAAENYIAKKLGF